MFDLVHQDSEVVWSWPRIGVQECDVGIPIPKLKTLESSIERFRLSLVLLKREQMHPCVRSHRIRGSIIGRIVHDEDIRREHTSE